MVDHDNYSSTAGTLVTSPYSWQLFPWLAGPDGEPWRLQHSSRLVLAALPTPGQTAGGTGSCEKHQYFLATQGKEMLWWVPIHFPLSLPRGRESGEQLQKLLPQLCQEWICLSLLVQQTLTVRVSGYEISRGNSNSATQTQVSRFHPVNVQL